MLGDLEVPLSRVVVVRGGQIIIQVVRMRASIIIVAMQLTNKGLGTTDPKATINNTASIGDSSSNNNNLPIILGAVFAALAAFILVGLVYARKRRASSNGSSRAREVDGDKAVGPLAFANTQDTEDGAEATVASWAGA